MSQYRLSIIIPCFNEENMIVSVLENVRKIECGLEKEIIIINDCSTDNTCEKLNDYLFHSPDKNIKILHHKINMGKGACIQTALTVTTGDLVIIQDADLEYNPAEYLKLLKPIVDGHADVVFGSRFRGSEAHRVLFFFHTLGNKLLTFLSNLFTGINLTDMETGYKMFRTDIIKNIRFKEKRFGFEPEVTAKISRIKNIRIYEVGISYYGRTYNEGKKINWKDGFRAIYCIFKYNIFSRK